MSNSAISIWFDLFVSGGMAEAGFGGDSPPTKGHFVHQIPVSSMIIKNVYWGDLDKASGTKPPIGRWEWIPRCVEVPEKVCGYPLPYRWRQVVHGGERETTHQKEFLALDQEKPHGKKIGAIAGFAVEDFKGYSPTAKRTKRICALML